MKEYLLPVGLILLGVAIFLLWRVLRRANPWSRTPYEQQDAFLSPAELAFYQVLDQLVGEDIAICPKPAVREILRVRPQVRRDRQKYFNWISQKHVDFVLCDRATMQVLCAVELDDSSHRRSDRRQRDAFMDKAFRKAKLPLFHIPCKRSYGAGELGELCDFLTHGRGTDLSRLRNRDGAAHRSKGSVCRQTVLWLSQFSTVPPDDALSAGAKRKQTKKMSCSGNFPNSSEKRNG